MDPYQILEVSPNASKEEIRTAYRNLVKKYHPDRYPEGPQRDFATEKIKKINEQQMNKIAQELQGVDEKQAEKLLWWLNGAVTGLKAQEKHG